MKKVIATGRTVDDAVTSALVKLGVTRSQATIRVISEPVKGWLGFIGGKDAEVEVSVPMNPDESAKDFLSGALVRMGVESRIRARESNEGGEPATVLEIVADDQTLPVLIGKHGSTLDALQYLVNVVANRGHSGYVKFIVDAGDYRQRRREGLWRIAERAAERAVRTRRPVALEAMPATDRKVVHTHLQDRSDVTTSSEGVEPNRKVVVLPVGVGVENRSGKPKRSGGGRVSPGSERFKTHSSNGIGKASRSRFGGSGNAVKPSETPLRTNKSAAKFD